MPSFKRIGRLVVLLALIDTAGKALGRRGGGGAATFVAPEILGVGNSIYRDAHTQVLAQRLVELGVAESVTDAQLSSIWTAVKEQAVAGNMEAAAVVAEVAQRQRSDS